LGSARRLLAEAHFRAAVRVENPQQCLNHLDAIEKISAGDGRVDLVRSVAFWRLGDHTRAVEALECAGTQIPHRPGLAYLRQLGRLASGQALQTDGLAPIESNTLRLVQNFAYKEVGNAVDDLAVLAREPIMGQTEIWSALVSMHGDGCAAPVDLLRQAVGAVRSKPARAVLQYYLGVAYRRRDQIAEAVGAWQSAVDAGFRAPWALENLAYLRREQAIELARAERWQEIADLAKQTAAVKSDRILAETIGVAFFHLGHQAAEAGKWSLAAQHWRAASQIGGSRQLAQNLALAEEALGNWIQAAEAWRDMARRRPRKADHPEALSDAQVAAIWKHAAECYEKAGWEGEVATCLATAVKYAGDDLELRLELADALWEADRVDATVNELQRILERDGDYVPALTRLATIYTERWGYDPLPLWRRALAAEPENQEVRDALAQHYLEQVGAVQPRNWFGSFLHRTEKQRIKVLEQGLKDVPGHPRLLIQMGVLYRAVNRKKDALRCLVEAYQAAPRDLTVIGPALHELLHLEDTEKVEGLIVVARQIPGLLGAFWVDQGERVLKCALSMEWAKRFFDEAVTLSGEGRGEDTRALAYLSIYDAAMNEGAEDLAEEYAQRARAEVPRSGVLEYIEASKIGEEEGDMEQARRLLRKAQRMARKANEVGIESRAKQAEVLTLGGIERLLDMMDLDWEALDEFRSRF
jgi:tetratricopeptide (TPR) repeat protein